MIAQQTTRGLLKALAAVVAGGAVPGGAHGAFVAEAVACAATTCAARRLEELSTPEALCAAFQQRASWLLLYVARLL